MTEGEDPILDSPRPTDEKQNAQPSFLVGSLPVIAYYAVGVIFAWLAYSIVGHSYAHGPGLHHIIILFTVLGGLGWTIVTGFRYLGGNASRKVRGALFTNLFAILGFAWLMYNIVGSESKVIEPTGSDKIYIEHKGDTGIVYHNDNIIYMEVKGSVLINLIDSTRAPFAK